LGDSPAGQAIGIVKSTGILLLGEHARVRAPDVGLQALINGTGNGTTQLGGDAQTFDNDANSYLQGKSPCLYPDGNRDMTRSGMMFTPRPPIAACPALARSAEADSAC